MGESNQEPKTASKRSRIFRLALVLVVLLGLNIIGTWLGHLVNFQLFPRHDTLLHAFVITAVVVYVLLMAIPFMPGIEVGMAVMMLLGYKSSLLIYLCTLLALSISYVTGRFFPLHLVHRLLEWLYLEKASALVRELEPLNPQERLDLLNKRAPAKFAPFLLNHRYLTILLVLNLPGNALIGGGGGIGLVAGMSRIVPFYKYLFVVAVAVLPVPLLIYFRGL